MTHPVQPKLIIHGGAGSSLQGKGGLQAVRQDLQAIVAATYAQLDAGASAVATVAYGCRWLEDNPRFNAGTGAVLQADGQIRLSAALMDGVAQRFSGVINAARVKNPIDLAIALQAASDRVLSDYGAADLARELQLPLYDPVTTVRLREWLAERQGHFQRDMAGVVAEPEPTPSLDLLPGEPGRGTIGVVAFDQQGRIAVGTSTGGKGFERIGRVSDSAMPAGTYATAQAGVSCTGIGEDIINECLAARVVVRVTDGLSLAAAMNRSIQEASEHQCDLGAIALDATGAIAWGKTSDLLLAAYHNGTTIGDTLEAALGTVVGTA